MAMSALIARGSSSLETPRSPVSVSTHSSRRGSLRQASLEKQPKSATSHFPRNRLTRATSWLDINTDAPNEPRIADLAHSSAKVNRPHSSNVMTEQVCLCQRDPKIPRPRNAFILYRQHYQAQVVAQNPGLANPEISKIIGEQWREQHPDVKSDWKRLAEEEKQRHQRQYPNYRYQPRRAGKATGIRSISASTIDHQVRCPKCHGRYITTPNTPLTPFTIAPSAEARTDHHLHQLTTSCLTELQGLSDPSLLQNTGMDTTYPLLLPQGQRRALYAPSHFPSTQSEPCEELDLMNPSPGQKRRRFNEDNQRGFAANSPISYSTSPQYRGVHLPMSAGAYRSQQLPGQVMLNRSGSMAPPTLQSPINQPPRHQYPTRSNAFDESLRLPPLQTASASSSIWSNRQDARMEAREIQARSVEAMVMTIPYVNKIKVLKKISPCLQPPGPTSLVHEIRGAVVAVEGIDTVLLSEVGTFILEYLHKDPSFAVKTWTSTLVSTKGSISQPSDIEMTDAAASTASSSFPHSLSKLVDNDPIVNYLSIISDWHKKSHEITKHITFSPSHWNSVGESEVSAPANTIQSQNVKVLPIALLPNGFSLSTSDVFALHTPINDSYAPVDHWQWMATLWRGIVGPDLTVYVTRVGREEIGKYGSVEIRGDCSAIIIRIPETGKMDEKTARRLGFEVVEFVRNVDCSFGRL